MSDTTATKEEHRMASRLGGKRFALIFASSVIGCFAFIIWQFFATYWPAGEVLMQVEHSTGNLSVHADERGHVHLVQRDQSGEGVWTMGLHGVPDEGGITIGEGLVTVRVLDFEDVLETHAFHLETGEFAWRSGRGERPLPEGERALLAPTLWSGNALYEFDAWDSELIAIDRSNGEESWREPLSDDASVELDGERVCVNQANVRRCRGLADTDAQASP